MLNEVITIRPLSCRHLPLKNLLKVPISVCQLEGNKAGIQGLWQDETKCNHCLGTALSPLLTQTVS